MGRGLKWEDKMHRKARCLHRELYSVVKVLWGRAYAQATGLFSVRSWFKMQKYIKDIE